MRCEEGIILSEIVNMKCSLPVRRCRCPDSAKVRTKMLYASSKDALKKKLVGINHEVQATEHSELNQKDVTEKILCKMVK